MARKSGAESVGPVPKSTKIPAALFSRGQAGVLFLLLCVLVVGIFYGYKAIRSVVVLSAKRSSSPEAQFINVLDPTHDPDVPFSWRHILKIIHAEFDVTDIESMFAQKQDRSSLPSLDWATSDERVISIAPLIGPSHWQRSFLPVDHAQALSNDCRATADVHNVELTGYGIASEENKGLVRSTVSYRRPYNEIANYQLRSELQKERLPCSVGTLFGGVTGVLGRNQSFFQSCHLFARSLSIVEGSFRDALCFNQCQVKSVGLTMNRSPLKGREYRVDDTYNQQSDLNSDGWRCVGFWFGAVLFPLSFGLMLYGSKGIEESGLRGLQLGKKFLFLLLLGGIGEF